MSYILTKLIGVYLKYKGIKYNCTLFCKGNSIFCDIYQVYSYRSGKVIKENYIRIKEKDILISLSNILKIIKEIKKALNNK